MVVNLAYTLETPWELLKGGKAWAPLQEILIWMV